jgi:REP element-mobilizing transposase RayT
MGRPKRPTAAGFYHVAARGQADERLFRDESDYLRFESELRAVAKDTALRCLGVCVLSTHYHLLLETENGALPVAMQRLNQRYAHTYNQRYGRRGHAFAERYLSVPITSDDHLVTVYRYVMRNPVEAGLCAHPLDWTWSSYPAATGRGSRFEFADPAFIVSCFDGSLESLRLFVESEREDEKRCLAPRTRRQAPEATSGAR